MFKMKILLKNMWWFSQSRQVRYTCRMIVISMETVLWYAGLDLSFDTYSVVAGLHTLCSSKRNMSTYWV